MPRKYVYLTLCLIGTVVPYLSFLPWVMEHGVDIPLMVDQLFANSISTFFALDVTVSSIVLWAFVAFEGPRVGVRYTWAPIVASLVVGVSADLPLFLFLRETALERSPRH